MKGVKYFVLFYVLSLVFGNAASAQEEMPARQEEQSINDEEIQWVSAQVVSIDAGSKNLLVEYLDFETNTEKKMTVTVDKNTFFEKVGSIEELKPRDNVLVDYIVDEAKNNIAKYICLEPDKEIPEK